MKLVIEFLYINLSSKFSFRKNWRSESYSVIKDLKQFSSLFLTFEDISLSLSLSISNFCNEDLHVVFSESEFHEIRGSESHISLMGVKEEVL